MSIMFSLQTLEFWSNRYDFPKTTNLNNKFWICEGCLLWLNTGKFLNADALTTQAICRSNNIDKSFRALLATTDLYGMFRVACIFLLKTHCFLSVIANAAFLFYINFQRLPYHSARFSLRASTPYLNSVSGLIHPCQKRQKIVARIQENPSATRSKRSKIERDAAQKYTERVSTTRHDAVKSEWCWAWRNETCAKGGQSFPLSKKGPVTRDVIY